MLECIEPCIHLGKSSLDGLVYAGHHRHELGELNRAVSLSWHCSIVAVQHSVCTVQCVDKRRLHNDNNVSTQTEIKCQNSSYTDRNESSNNIQNQVEVLRNDNKKYKLEDYTPKNKNSEVFSARIEFTMCTSTYDGLQTRIT